jgi:hypothetical protein
MAPRNRGRKTRHLRLATPSVLSLICFLIPFAIAVGHVLVVLVVPSQPPQYFTQILSGLDQRHLIERSRVLVPPSYFPRSVNRGAHGRPTHSSSAHVSRIIIFSPTSGIGARAPALPRGWVAH